MGWKNFFLVEEATIARLSLADVRGCCLLGVRINYRYQPQLPKHSSNCGANSVLSQRVPIKDKEYVYQSLSSILQFFNGQALCKQHQDVIVEWLGLRRKLRVSWMFASSHPVSGLQDMTACRWERLVIVRTTPLPRGYQAIQSKDRIRNIITSIIFGRN